MTTLLTQVREAVWTALDNDADLAAFMGDGRRYRLDGDGFDPRRIAPGDCPCLIVQPAAATSEPLTPVHDLLDIALAIRGLVHDRAAGPIETFFSLVRDRLMRADFDIDALRRRRIEKPVFEGPLSGSIPPGFWAFECRLALTLRLRRTDTLIVV